MDTTYIEYDDSGEIFHVCTVSTTEGDLNKFAPHPSAPQEEHDAHEQMIKDEIARRDKAVRDELTAHAAAGKKLVVLPAGAPIPEHGRHRVVNGQLKSRTDAEFKAWRDAQNPGQPNKP